MSFFVANDGDKLIAQYITNNATPENLKIKVFVNNVTPDKSFTAASLTECSASGYAAITTSAGSFTITEGTGAGTTPTTIAYPQQTFALTAGATCYGYYVIGATSTKLYLAELFTGGPYVIPSGGGNVLVTVNFSSVS
jgi:hypothetical protein